LTWLSPDNPAFQAVIVPFAIAFAVAGFCVLVRRKAATPLAVVGIALALAVAYWLAFSWPPFPPRASSQKLGYLFVASGLVSLFCMLKPDTGRLWTWVLAALVFAGLLWIGEARLRQAQVVTPVILLAASGAMIAVLESARGKPADIAVTGLVAAAGLAGLAFMAPSASIAQLALAVAAALAGYLLWTWPKPRLGFATAGLAAAFAPLIWLAGQAVFYTGASRVALAIWALTAAAPWLRARFFAQSAIAGDAARPIVAGVIAVAIAGIAVVIASLGQSGGGYAG
jgi:hypothetical protein